jgi:uncharacterized membrane protein
MSPLVAWIILIGFIIIIVGVLFWFSRPELYSDSNTKKQNSRKNKST